MLKTICIPLFGSYQYNRKIINGDLILSPKPLPNISIPNIKDYDEAFDMLSDTLVLTPAKHVLLQKNVADYLIDVNITEHDFVNGDSNIINLDNVIDYKRITIRGMNLFTVINDLSKVIEVDIIKEITEERIKAAQANTTYICSRRFRYIQSLLFSVQPHDNLYYVIEEIYGKPIPKWFADKYNKLCTKDIDRLKNVL